MILAATGHRPEKLGGYTPRNPVRNAVIAQLDIELMRLRPDKVIVGMALGVDQWVAELCIANDLPFIAAVPYPSFPNHWPGPSQNHYRWLLTKAEGVHYVSMSNDYTPALLHARNEWMVRNSDELLAVQRTDTAGERSGTAGTIAYAVSLHKPVHYIRVGEHLQILARDVERSATRRRQGRPDVEVNLPAPQNAVIEEPIQEMERRVREATAARTGTFIGDPPPRPLSANETRALLLNGTQRGRREGGGFMAALEQMTRNHEFERLIRQNEQNVLQALEIPPSMMEMIREQGAEALARESPGREAAARRARQQLEQDLSREAAAARVAARREQRLRISRELGVIDELLSKPDKEEKEDVEVGVYKRVIDID